MWRSYQGRKFVLWSGLSLGTGGTEEMWLVYGLSREASLCGWNESYWRCEQVSPLNRVFFFFVVLGSESASHNSLCPKKKVRKVISFFFCVCRVLFSPKLRKRRRDDGKCGRKGCERDSGDDGDDHLFCVVCRDYIADLNRDVVVCGGKSPGRGISFFLPF